MFYQSKLSLHLNLLKFTRNTQLKAAGVRVAIHEPGTTIFPEEQGFDAAVGSQTAFAMRANELRDLGLKK